MPVIELLGILFAFGTCLSSLVFSFAFLTFLLFESVSGGIIESWGCLNMFESGGTNTAPLDCGGMVFFMSVLHPTSGTPRNSTGSKILDPLGSSDQYIFVSSFILSHLISSFMLLFSLLHTCAPLYPPDLSRTSRPLPCILLVYKP